MVLAAGPAVKGCPEAKLMVSFAWTIGWNPAHLRSGGALPQPLDPSCARGHPRGAGRGAAGLAGAGVCLWPAAGPKAKMRKIGTEGLTGAHGYAIIAPVAKEILAKKSRLVAWLSCRAHRSHRWGHRFESCCDHHNPSNLWIRGIFHVSTGVWQPARKKYRDDTGPGLKKQGPSCILYLAFR